MLNPTYFIYLIDAIIPIKLIKMYDYIVLDNLNAPTYKHLTYPWLQERLDQLSSQNLTNIAIGVALQGQPVGLVLAEYPQSCIQSESDDSNSRTYA
jgi:hypothetical protein